MPFQAAAWDRGSYIEEEKEINIYLQTNELAACVRAYSYTYRVVLRPTIEISYLSAIEAYI